MHLFAILLYNLKKKHSKNCSICRVATCTDSLIQKYILLSFKGNLPFNMDFEKAFQFYGVETFNLYKLRDNFLNAKVNCNADEILLNPIFKPKKKYLK